MKFAGKFGLLRAAGLMGLALCLAGAGAAAARGDDDGGQNARAVRLSNVEGQVQLSQGGQTVADHALANTPLFEGAQLTTGDDGRAEVQFEDGSAVRIPPDSSLTLSVLKPGATEMVLNSGMGYFELQGGSQSGAIVVHFDGSQATASGFTVLRVKLDKSPGELAVFSGSAHVEGSGGEVDARGGESVSLAGYSIAESIEPDSWDAWNSDRDQALTAAEAGPSDATKGLPNAGNPAWGDLNQNGTWYDVPDQGNVWSPYEASNSDWDPFGNGYWMDQPGYGYMWISGEPWGFMPYQCGAWNWYDSFGWGWAPGMCNPWWGSGGGWFFTVGHFPRWYRLPGRPGRPMPRPGGGSPGRPRGPARPVGPEPIITVNRGPSSGPGMPLPPREPNHPVQIGGVVGRPLPPTHGSMGYNHMMPVINRPENPGARMNPGSNPRSIYVPAPRPEPTRPVYVPAPRPEPSRGVFPAPAAPPANGNPGGYRPAPAPSAPHPSSGGSHPSSPPSGGGGSHPSSSGGGSHPSGGGGSSHSGGGGGGHH